MQLRPEPDADRTALLIMESNIAFGTDYGVPPGDTALAFVPYNERPVIALEPGRVTELDLDDDK